MPNQLHFHLCGSNVVGFPYLLLFLQLELCHTVGVGWGPEIHISETTSAEESLKCLELWWNSIKLYYVSKLGCVNRNIIAVLLTYRALQFNILKLCKKTFFSERGGDERKLFWTSFFSSLSPLSPLAFYPSTLGRANNVDIAIRKKATPS